jgi:hypothetical protein
VAPRGTSYVRKRKDKCISELLDQIWMAPGLAPDVVDKIKQSAVPIFEEILCTKYIGWKYEQEIRIFTDLNQDDCGLYYQDFDESIRLREITIGHRCCLEPEQVLKQLHDDSEAVKIFKAKASTTEFKIIREQICSALPPR